MYSNNKVERQFNFINKTKYPVTGTQYLQLMFHLYATKHQL